MNENVFLPRGYCCAALLHSRKINSRSTNFRQWYVVGPFFFKQTRTALTNRCWFNREKMESRMFGHFNEKKGKVKFQEGPFWGPLPRKSITELIGRKSRQNLFRKLETPHVRLSSRTIKSLSRGAKEILSSENRVVREARTNTNGKSSWLETFRIRWSIIIWFRLENLPNRLSRNE